jgi:hypothetical protein
MQKALLHGEWVISTSDTHVIFAYSGDRLMFTLDEFQEVMDFVKPPTSPTSTLRSLEIAEAKRILAIRSLDSTEIEPPPIVQPVANGQRPAPSYVTQNKGKRGAKNISSGLEWTDTEDHVLIEAVIQAMAEGRFERGDKAEFWRSLTVHLLDRSMNSISSRWFKLWKNGRLTPYASRILEARTFGKRAEEDKADQEKELTL